MLAWYVQARLDKGKFRGGGGLDDAKLGLGFIADVCAIRLSIRRAR